MFEDRTMMRFKDRLLACGARIVRCRRDERGVISIEMALSAIAFVMLVTGVISFGSILFIQANMMNAARDTARSLAVGEIQSTDAQTYAEARMVDFGFAYVVTPTMPAGGSQDVVVEITAPMSGAALIDYLGLFASQTLRARVAMRSET
jgi:Flp pilus assembly protein TadG